MKWGGQITVGAKDVEVKEPIIEEPKKHHEPRMPRWDWKKLNAGFTWEGAAE